MRQSAGFTMIELVMVIIILGILAAVAVPNMTGMGDFQAQAFRDSVTGGLRYGQKTATSHRRLVCATFTANTLTLTIAFASGAADCSTTSIPARGTALPLPTGAAFVQSGDVINAVFNPVPAALFFQPDGRATSDGAGLVEVSPSLTIAGQAITVVGATGHVR